MRVHKMKTKWLLLLSVIFFSVNWIYAYPIPPRSLRQLYTDAELIVVAEVGKTEMVKGDDPWNDGKATILISSRIKGAEKGSSIEVYYSLHIHCPAPARYETGKTVLAFLAARRKGDGYQTCSRSYGTKYLTKEELDNYLKSINALRQILEIKNEKERLEKMVEWMVRCVENKDTRFEGLLDLDERNLGRFLPVENPEPEFSKFLNQSQRDRLFAILKSEPPSGNPQYYTLMSIMSILAKSLNSKTLSNIVEQYDKVEGNDEVRQRALISDFIANYKKQNKLVP